MYRAFAVDPEFIAASTERFRYVYELFGWEKGRLIAKIPVDWEKQVLEKAKVAEIPDRALANIYEQLNAGRKDKVLKPRSAYDPQKAWLQNIAEANAAEDFGAVITDEAAPEVPNTVSNQELNREHESLIVRGDKSVRATADNYSKELGLLLTESKELLFIDPYYNPRKSAFKKVLSKLLETAQSTSQVKKSAEIHFKWQTANPGNAEFKENATTWFDFIPEKMSLKIFQWKETYEGDRGQKKNDLHPRYLLTELGGVRMDKGFAEAPMEWRDLARMEGGRVKELREAYHPENGIYELYEPGLEIFANGYQEEI